VIRPAVAPNSSITIARWIAVRAEVAQQLVQPLRLGHEHGRPQQRAQVQVGRALQLQQVLRHQDADDVVALALIDREARVRGPDHAVQLVVVIGIDVEQVHARCRDHHVAGGQPGHPDHALEHHPRLRSDQLLLLGVGQRLDELVAGSGSWCDQLEELLEQIAPRWPRPGRALAQWRGTADWMF
jgi:hypothetical protein